MAVACITRHLTSGFNALTSSNSRSFLIGLKQHSLYHFDPAKKQFVDIEHSSIDSTKKVALVFFSNSDLLVHAFTQKFKELRNLEGYEVIVCRWSDPEQLKEMMKNTKKVINSPKTSETDVDLTEQPKSKQTQRKIDKLIFMGHGCDELIQGGWPFSNNFLPTFFNEKTLKNKVIEDNLNENAEIALFSCSTGTPGGSS